ncbi:MAG: hypothetical protein K9J21_07205 [Bacteroidales bacterium]|nr:hypothetical protein [Bacteroidales bacterium]
MKTCNQHGRTVTHYTRENGQLILLCDMCIDQVIENYMEDVEPFERLFAQEAALENIFELKNQ